MALQTILGGTPIPPHDFYVIDGSTTVTTLSTVGYGIAFVVQVPKSGTITAVGIDLGTVAGTGVSMTAGIQTLASGLPSDLAPKFRTHG